MKATFNLKTRILHVTGKEIESKTIRVPNRDAHDYWNSVRSKKTGEPLYDINLYMDDFVNDGKHPYGDDKNPKNWQAQFVDLIVDKKGKFGYSTGNDWRILPLKVKRK